MLAGELEPTSAPEARLNPEDQQRDDGGEEAGPDRLRPNLTNPGTITSLNGPGVEPRTTTRPATGPTRACGQRGIGSRFAP